MRNSAINFGFSARRASCILKLTFVYCFFNLRFAGGRGSPLHDPTEGRHAKAWLAREGAKNCEFNSRVSSVAQIKLSPIDAKCKCATRKSNQAARKCRRRTAIKTSLFEQFLAVRLKLNSRELRAQRATFEASNSLQVRAEKSYLRLLRNLRVFACSLF